MFNPLGESEAVRTVRQEFTPLVRESRHAIGNVAVKLYKALNKLPAVKHDPTKVTLENAYRLGRTGMRQSRVIREAAYDESGESIFRPKDKEKIDKQKHPIPGYNDLFAVAGLTQYDTSAFYSPITGHVTFLRLPGYPRVVNLWLWHPSSEESHLTNFYEAQIDSAGNAKTELSRPSTDNPSFHSPSALRSAIAIDYGSRLATAGLVAVGLQLVYGIEQDITSLEQLYAEWSDTEAPLPEHLAHLANDKAPLWTKTTGTLARYASLSSV